MSSLNFKIGDLCEVMSENKVSMSKIQDIIDDENYLIDFPLRDGVLEFFHENDRFSVSVIRNDESGSTCSYKFDAVVKGRSITNDNIKIPVLNIMRVSKITKTQRRNFFRISYASPVVVKLPDPLHKTHTDFDANLVDISGGGIKLKSYNKLPEESVELIFKLLDLNLVLEADFVASDYMADNQYYLTRYKYSNISNEMQEKIISRLTKLQSDMLKKSMSKYENQRNSNIEKEDIKKRLEEEEKNNTQILQLKLISVIISFLTFVIYLFTMPATSYPLDKLFGIAPRVIIVDQFYIYTVFMAITGTVISSLGLYWNNRNKLRGSSNTFFLINTLVNAVFLILGLMKK